VITTDGRKIERWADENYRGSPHNPLSDRDLEGKFRDCAEGLLSENAIQQLFERVWHIVQQVDVGQLFTLLDWQSTQT